MKKGKFIVLTICILSILLGCLSMYYPNKNKNETSFSYEKAKEDLKVIAKEPHSNVYHEDELKDVREYIVNELNELNMNPEVFNYKDLEWKKGVAKEINNIYGKIDGKSGEDGSYILLVSHYDSAGNNSQNKEGYSCGAADAGYGVATILETLRCIKNSGKTLENGIKVLITDGEEMTLLGSGEEMNKNFSLYKNASYVINLEARGTDGPILMYQTNEKNSKVLELYKNANYPITTSLVTDIYKGAQVSDFYHIEKSGLMGINFASVDKVENYHTAGDSYENISDKSLNHYGQQVLPIVEEFIYSNKYSDVDYFKEGTESIFFTILPNVVISYSLTLGIILSVLAIVAVVAIIIINKSSIKAILKGTAKNLIQIVGVAILGLIISFGLATISGVKFNYYHMDKIIGDDILVIILPIILLAVIFKIEMKNKDNIKEEILSGVLIQTIMLVALMIFSMGASYLAMIPLVLTISSLAIIKIIKKENVKYILLIPVVAIIILYIPIINIFNMAFSFASLPLILAGVMIGKSLMIPLIKEITNI